LSKLTGTTQVFDELKTTVRTEGDAWHGHTLNNTAWHVYRGDARAVLGKLPNNEFHCAMTSPPYYWLRDYGVAQQIGLEETVDQYVQSLASVMDEVHRVLRRDGLLFLNLGDTYYSGKGEAQGEDRKSNKRRFGLRAVDKSGGLGVGLERKSMIGVPWRVALEMTRRKWVLRSCIIWHRDKRLLEAVKDRPPRSYEYVFMFAKDRKYFFDPQPLIAEEVDQDVWTITARPQATNGIRTAPFPDKLVQRCLDIGCPKKGSVIDPFAGSGTTLRVAVKSGRPATGIDLNPHFCEYMVNDLAKL
jgi:DNA modification methylase